MLLKNPKFWEYFPEYTKLKEEKFTIGCCNLNDKLYKKILEYIKQNPTKWMDFFKHDKLMVYVNGKTIIYERNIV